MLQRDKTTEGGYGYTHHSAVDYIIGFVDVSGHVALLVETILFGLKPKKRRSSMSYRTNSLFVLLVLLVVCLMFACSAICGFSKGNKLTEVQANELAVKLANEECMTKFKSEPFDASSYKPVFENSIWTWGQLDPAGVKGYSAVIIFDSYGNKQNVQVAFASDKWQ